MKRVKAACICQTLHFQLKEDIEHSIAARMVREEVEHYKRALEKNNTRYKIVRRPCRRTARPSSASSSSTTRVR